jgi:carbonic anhydrase
MESWKRILLQNKAWSQGKVEVLPDYFKDLAREQNPEFLWIGCSDSRVPAEEITGASPGELFVHRNIANLVVHTDLNLLSVLQFAVDHLEVKHIIVCGHYGCGGVRAALEEKSYGLLNTWLLHIKDLYSQNRQQIDILDEDSAARRMVELNVQRQVANLAKTEIVQRAWQQDKRPEIHGWVYDMTDGHINAMCRLDHTTELDSAFQLNSGL